MWHTRVLGEGNPPARVTRSPFQKNIPLVQIALGFGCPGVIPRPDWRDVVTLQSKRCCRRIL